MDQLLGRREKIFQYTGDLQRGLQQARQLESALHLNGINILGCLVGIGDGFLGVINGSCHTVSLIHMCLLWQNMRIPCHREATVGC